MITSNETSPPRILLVGPPGAGKSTLAPLLAEKLGWVSFDSDPEVEREYGSSISDLFRHGEESFFRECEYQVLQRLLQKEQAVIATGAGCVSFPPSLTLLKTVHATILWLDVALEEQLKRLQMDSNPRPLLTFDETLENRLMDIRQARCSHYEVLANEIIDTTHQSPLVLVKKIHEKFCFPPAKSSEQSV